MSAPVVASRSADGLAGVAPRGGSRWRKRVLLWVSGSAATAASLAGGIAIGLGLTAAALRNGEEIGSVTIGHWRLPVGEGTPAINPYQRAVLARTGGIPMSAGQGVVFTALRDDGGRKLDRQCTYTVQGAIPRARFWTIGAVDATGFAMMNGAERYAFTSANVLRAEGGELTVVVSPVAQPGNWLPLGGSGSFGIALRLYDSAVPGLGVRELAALTLPSISRGKCL